MTISLSERLSNFSPVPFRFRLIALAVCIALSATPVVQALDLYWAGGTTDIPDNTPISSNAVKLCGVWNTSTKNWAIDRNGTTYVAWTNGANNAAFLSPYTNTSSCVTITAAVDIVLNRLNADLTKPAVGGVYGTFITITATTPRTMTLAGSNPTIEVPAYESTRYLRLDQNIRLAGVDGLTKSNGTGYLLLDGDCSGLSGKLSLRAGGAATSYASLRLSKTANLLGISEFDLQSGSLVLASSNGVNAHIGGSAVVRTGGGLMNSGFLHSGGFEYQSVGGGVVSTERLSQLDMDGFGFLIFKAAASPHGVLTLSHPTAGINRGREGKGCAIIATDANDVLTTDVVVSNGIAPGVIIPWLSSNKARPIRLNAASGILETVPTTTAPNNLATWGGSTNYRIESGFAPAGSITAGTVIGSLGIYGNASTFTLTNGVTPTDTLTLQNGQISYVAAGGSGVTIRGGSLTSGTNELCIFTGDSTANGSLNIQSSLVGNNSVIFAGSQELSFSGAGTNTYTGTTYVNNGTLSLSRGYQASIPGDLVIRSGGTCQDLINNAINTNANVTVREGGTLSIADGNEKGQTLNGVLTVNNGLVTTGQSYGGADFALTAPGVGLVFENGGTIAQTTATLNNKRRLRLLTDVRYTAGSTNQAVFTSASPFMDAEINLTLASAATRTFDVANSPVLPNTVPDLLVDIALRQTAGYPASLVKKGEGTLQLQRLTGPFNGGISVTGGTLVVTGPFVTQSVCSVSWAGGYYTTVTVPSTNGLAVGQAVIGPYIQADTVISAIPSATTITISRYLNTGSAGSATFTNLASSAAGTCAITVGSTGTLAGNSLAPSQVTIATSGTLAPGTPASPTGTLAIGGNLTMATGSTLAIDIASATSNDAVKVYGNLSLSGSVVPTAVGSYKLPASGSWTIATYSGTASGSLTAPDRYKVLIDTLNKQVVLTHYPTGTLICVR